MQLRHRPQPGEQRENCQGRPACSLGNIKPTDLTWKPRAHNLRRRANGRDGGSLLECSILVGCEDHCGKESVGLVRGRPNSSEHTDVSGTWTGGGTVEEGWRVDSGVAMGLGRRGGEEAECGRDRARPEDMSDRGQICSSLPHVGTRESGSCYAWQAFHSGQVTKTWSPVLSLIQPGMKDEIC